MALTKKQYRVIRVAREKLGLEEEHYRDLLFGATGKMSATQLDNYGFDALLKAFETLGFVLTGDRRNRGNAYHIHPRGMMSPAQQGKIAKLREVLGMGMTEFIGVAEQATGKKMGWDQWEAEKIIEGLKAVGRRRPKSAPTRGAAR